MIITTENGKLIPLGGFVPGIPCIGPRFNYVGNSDGNSTSNKTRKLCARTARVAFNFDVDLTGREARVYNNVESATFRARSSEH